MNIVKVVITLYLSLSDDTNDESGHFQYKSSRFLRGNSELEVLVYPTIVEITMSIYGVLVKLG
ncbi:hypothetical protein WNY51_00735 [Pseudocolwellia sp. AS88]|uniref:hypothetical protein n=1 Tax=Pseudocolwellia sp. AS88 TaxID=3063958 RepID=UPI0026EDB83C|nr:hypothetical protein [Pseudocolwellia sp. AS88]MDO7086409.1 hypothetical protein [Pseudocolwellia sp. AS88]